MGDSFSDSQVRAALDLVESPIGAVVGTAQQRRAHAIGVKYKRAIGAVEEAEAAKELALQEIEKARRLQETAARAVTAAHEEVTAARARLQKVRDLCGFNKAKAQKVVAIDDVLRALDHP